MNTIDGLTFVDGDDVIRFYRFLYRSGDWRGVMSYILDDGVEEGKIVAVRFLGAEGQLKGRDKIFTSIHGVKSVRRIEFPYHGTSVVLDFDGRNIQGTWIGQPIGGTNKKCFKIITCSVQPHVSAISGEPLPAVERIELP